MAESMEGRRAVSTRRLKARRDSYGSGSSDFYDQQHEGQTRGSECSHREKESVGRETGERAERARTNAFRFSRLLPTGRFFFFPFPLLIRIVFLTNSDPVQDP